MNSENFPFSSDDEDSTRVHGEDLPYDGLTYLQHQDLKYSGRDQIPGPDDSPHSIWDRHHIDESPVAPLDELLALEDPDEDDDELVFGGWLQGGDVRPNLHRQRNRILSAPVPPGYRRWVCPDQACGPGHLAWVVQTRTVDAEARLVDEHNLRYHPTGLAHERPAPTDQDWLEMEHAMPARAHSYVSMRVDIVICLAILGILMALAILVFALT